MIKSRPILVGAAGTLIVWCLLMAFGLFPRESALYAIALTFQVVSGGYLWLLFIRSRGSRTVVDVLEFIGMGLALGSFLALISGEVLLRWIPSSLGWLVPGLVLTAIWLVNRLRTSHRELPRVEFSVWTLTGFVVSLAVGAISIGLNLARYPLSGVDRWSEYHVDMLYFEGLSQSLAKFGPGNSIFMSGSDIRYHWFSYGWIGQLNDFAGAQSFAGLTRVLPLVALIGVAAIATSWTARLTKVRWAPLLAGLLVVSGGFVGALFGAVLNFDSPSQAFSAVWLLALALVAWMFIARTSSRWLLLAGSLLGIASTGGKVSTGLLAVGALGIASLLGLVMRSEWWRRAVAVTALVALGALVTYVSVLSGGVGTQDFHVFSWMARASTAQGLNPGVSASAVAVGTLGLILAVIARWSGVALFFTSRVERRSFEAALSLGLVVCGLFPMLVLSQGINELWFAVSASAPLSVLSAVAIARAWNGFGHRAVLGTSVAAGLVLFVIGAAVWADGAMGSVSWRAWGPYVVICGAVLCGIAAKVYFRKSTSGVSVGLLVACSILVTVTVPARLMPDVGARLPLLPFPAGVSEFQDSILKGPRVIDIPTVTSSPVDLTPILSEWTTSEVDAATFLRERMSDSDVIVTNETSGFLMPALVGQLTYLSGSRYQWVYGTASSVQDLPERMIRSERFVGQNDESTYSDLCVAGVTWLWANKSLSHAVDWLPAADVVYSNESIEIGRFKRDVVCS